MLGDGFLQRVLAVLEHLDHELELLVQLGDRVLLLLLQLLFDLLHVLLEHLCLLNTNFDFILECDLLANQRVDLIRLFLHLIANLMTLALVDDTLRADVFLASLAQVLRLLLRVQKAKVLYLVFLDLISFDLL